MSMSKQVAIGWKSKIDQAEKTDRDSWLDYEERSELRKDAQNWGSCAIGEVLFGPGAARVDSTLNAKIAAAVARNCPITQELGHLFADAITRKNWKDARKYHAAIIKDTTEYKDLLLIAIRG